MWKKFKAWLVCRLGGHMIGKEPCTIYTVYNPPLVTLERTIQIPYEESKIVPEDYIISKISQQLAEEIRPFISISTCENIWENTIIYRGQIKIAEKVGK